MNNNLQDYFMLPRTLSNGIMIYPIRVRDYEHFRDLASKYIIYDIQQLEFQNKQQWEKCVEERIINPDSQPYISLKFKNVYEYLVYLYNVSKVQKEKLVKEIHERNIQIKRILTNTSNEELIQHIKEDDSFLDKIQITDENEIDNTKFIFNEITELFELITRNKIKFNGNTFEAINDENKTIGIIDNSMFEEFRENVMDMNLLFTPMISSSLAGQRAIENVIKSYNFQNQGKETSLDSMLATVSIHRQISDEELLNYSFYRLKFDFTVITREHFNLYNFAVAPYTSEAKPKELNEVIDLKVNPYDEMFNKTTHKIDKNAPTIIKK